MKGGHVSVAMKNDDEVAVDAVGARGTLTWLGHATVLVATMSGTRIVFDPWFEGNPKNPVSIDDVGEVHFIAVTHGHFDHMGSAVDLAMATGATIICIHEMSQYFALQGLSNIIGMNKGGTASAAEVALTMVGAEHSCGVSMGEDVPEIYGGNPVGYVLHLPDGQGGPIYVSGDTNVFGDMAIIRDLYHPETALIPIDGHYNMGPREAAYAVGLLGVRRVVPYHYGTFPMLTGTPDALRVQLGAANSEVVVDLDPGQSVPLGL
jgi:L-ascorbate metabolism protein UlaG (beta-lactamase superfamily)